MPIPDAPPRQAPHAAMAALYRRGLTQRQVADLLGVTPSTVAWGLRRERVRMRSKADYANPIDPVEAAGLRASGLSIDAVARVLHVDHHRLRAVLAEAPPRVRGRGVDLVAVEEAVNGHYRGPLTHAERREAVARSRLSASRLAERLGVTTRSVERIRARIRATQTTNDVNGTTAFEGAA